MSLGGVRVQLNGSLEFALGPRPVPVEVLTNQRHRDVTFRKSVVEFDAPHRGRLRALPYLWGCDVSRGAHEGVSVREARVGLGVIGIFFDGLAEEINRLLESVLRPLVPVKKTLQVELIGFGVLGVTLG